MMETEEVIIYCLLFIFGVGGFLLIQNGIPTQEVMEAWTFTGHEIVSAFMPCVSWVYLIAMLLVPTYKIIKEYG